MRWGRALAGASKATWWVPTKPSPTQSQGLSRPPSRAAASPRPWRGPRKAAEPRPRGCSAGRGPRRPVRGLRRRRAAAAAALVSVGVRLGQEQQLRGDGPGPHALGPPQKLPCLGASNLVEGQAEGKGASPRVPQRPHARRGRRHAPASLGKETRTQEPRNRAHLVGGVVACYLEG